jgi:hypothetical protein
MAAMRKTLLCLLVLGSSACGGGGGGAIGFGEFPDELESADCDFEVECGLMPDVGTCQDALAFDDGEIGSLQVAIDAGTVLFDEDAAGACVDSVRNQGCAFPGFHIDDPCVDVFAGTVAEGGACNIDAECSGNALCEATDPACDPTVACCPGTCGPSTEPQPIGGACESSSDCEDDAFCNIPAGQQAGTCDALITQQGASCNDFAACANPMICEITDFQNFVGTCEIPAAREATCDPNRLIPCTDLRDYCDPTATTCTPAIDVGGACDDDAGVFCLGFASCINLTCTADPGLGETCPTDGSQSCLGSLGCDNGTCALGPSSPVCPQ